MLDKLKKVLFLQHIINNKSKLKQMEAQKQKPTESNYSNRYFNGLEEKFMLLIPDEEITFKIKVKEMTTLRMLFESFNIDIAKKENTIEL